MATEERGSENDRATIAALLRRLGFLSGEDDPEEGAIVEALSRVLPGEHNIQLCVPYSDFSSTQAHPFEERTCSFLRAPLTSFGSLRGAPISAVVPRMQMALCTDRLLLWTSSRARSSGLLVEEKVSAQLLTLGEVLGAVVTGKHDDVVHVWVDQGPTLAFHTEPSSAQALQVYVDMAAR